MSERELDNKNIPEEGANKASSADIDAIIRLLDSYNETGGSRMKINVEEGSGEVISRQYHHGRCDVCSPFANGDAWDVLE